MLQKPCNARKTYLPFSYASNSFLITIFHPLHPNLASFQKKKTIPECSNSTWKLWIWYKKINSHSIQMICFTMQSQSHWSLEWKKNIYRLSERQAPLDIMGASFNPRYHTADGFQGSLQLWPHDVERRQYLRQLYAWPL